MNNLRLAIMSARTGYSQRNLVGPRLHVGILRINGVRGMPIAKVPVIGCGIERGVVDRNSPRLTA